MTEQDQLIHFTIDGKAVTIPKGTTVFAAAKQLEIEIPIFCYHDRMPPFGACRVCLVEVEKMPKLQTSCTLEATEGMVVNTKSEQAIKGRKEILEFLLINHPLDCPICDRGGECPLQEHTLHHGPGVSRFFEEKRHFKKPLTLGPVLMLDRERCIACARCTRFSDILAGDHVLELIERSYQTQVGTPENAPAESKFIGNTIMLCPVGALTSRVYRFRARPWDNDAAESTCTLCPVGCNLFLDSRDGEIVRTRSKENPNVNDIWLCDKGWFGYEFVNHPDRLRTPLIRRSGHLTPASWEEALSLIASNLTQSKPNGKIAAWGGNPLTIEENYLFQKLMREVVGLNHLDHRIGIPLFNLQEEGLPAKMQTTIGECEQLSFAILLGLDLTEEYPVIWLRLRQAINHGAAVSFFGHYAPEIAPYLSHLHLHAPGYELEVINQLSNFIQEGKKGAIFIGRQYLHTSKRGEILSALLKLQKSIPDLKLNILEGSGNSMGARLAGMHPELGPLGKQQNSGLNALQVLEEASNHNWDFLYVAGANPATKFPSKLWQEAREKLRFLVVQDLFLTETAQQADVVLPTLSFVEKEGSFVNLEGRVQSLLPGKTIPPNLYSDGEIFKQIAQLLNVTLTIEASFLEALHGSRLKQTHPEILENFKPSNKNQVSMLSATFAPTLFDQGVRMKHNLHLAQLIKEPKVRLHPQEGAKYGIQNGDRIKIMVSDKSICGKVVLDKQVALNTVVLPLGFEQIPVHELGTNLFNGMSIEIDAV